MKNTLFKKSYLVNFLAFFVVIVFNYVNSMNFLKNFTIQFTDGKNIKV
jgi:hypothetical protein